MKISKDFSHTIRFSADFHFWDTSLLTAIGQTPQGKGRPFDTTHEMDATLLQNINHHIGENDILFFLGDFSVYDMRTIQQQREKIRCKNIHCIVGNIDIHFTQYGELFTSVHHYQQVVFEKRNTTAVLFHYPLLVRDKAYAGRIHLHGHTHNRLPPNQGKMMDVGVDTYHFKPYRIEEIIESMNQKEIVLQYGSPRTE